MSRVLVKLARISTSKDELHEDHYLDAINYLAIALEVAKRDPNRTAES